MNVRQVLVPTDLSKASLEGVKMAANFAEIYGSTVDLMHVIPLMSYYADSIDNLGLPFDMEKDIYPKALQKVNEKLHEIAEKYIPKEHRGLLINQVGRKPSLVISEQANNGHYDLVIMSNKGGHGGDSIRSNITEKVIQYSKIPVLSLDSSLSKADVKTILVPVDGSEEANAALIPAFELAKTFQADIKLIHIIEPYTLGMEVIPPFMDDNEAVYNSLMQNISTYLAKHPILELNLQRSGTDYEDYLVQQKKDESFSINFKTVIKKDFSPHIEISNYAEENANLVVMSTHGRTGIARVILGSTTGMVAQHLKKPLLTFRPKKTQS